jgi:hypothetical protein
VSWVGCLGLNCEEEREEVKCQTIYISTDQGTAVLGLEWVLFKRVFATYLPAPQLKRIVAGAVNGCIYWALV